MIETTTERHLCYLKKVQAGPEASQMVGRETFGKVLGRLFRTNSDESELERDMYYNNIFLKQRTS
jgi:hypothetical protein